MNLRMMFNGFGAAALLAVLAVAPGCGSADGGSDLGGGGYYGIGFSDPWYYGGYYNDPDIIVTPPRGDRPVRPDQPIAKPPSFNGPSARPMPSIPSGARVSGRR